MKPQNSHSLSIKVVPLFAMSDVHERFHIPNVSFESFAQEKVSFERHLLYGLMKHLRGHMFYTSKY